MFHSSDSQGNNKEAYLLRKNITSAPVARYVLSHTNLVQYIIWGNCSREHVQSETSKERKRDKEGRDFGKKPRNFIVINLALVVEILILSQEIIMQGKRANPLYRTHGTQFFRGCYSRVAWMFSWRISSLMSFRFVSKHLLQAKELRLSICFNTFRNLNRSLNKRRMSPAQTITTE